ncbi:hypothetical protein WJX73_000478 [Symbiochloris irregularis]|uniref:Enoyl reductase (ER) domain-containing protein n=1 Tax=Symbiochloris irregularis TaxID=706552 RepID=A0AAW1NV08_9CHLO
MSQAVQITEWAPARWQDHVSLAQNARPKPAAGEVLIRFVLRPVLPYNVIELRGKLGPNQPLPYVPGTEGLAVVEEPAAGSSKFKQGQRVLPGPFALKRGSGSWQQFVALPEEDLLPVPDSVSDAAAAQLWVNPMTAVLMLDYLAVPEGEWLIQTAAGSVLGRILLALAKKRGIRTINVVRRSAAKAQLQSLGADEVIATDAEDIEQRVHQITGGKGAWGAVDAVAGDTTGKLVRSIRAGGTVLVYGILSSDTFTAPVLEGFGKFVHPFARPVHMSTWTREQQLAFCLKVIKLVEDGTIVLSAGKTFPLERFMEAVAASEEVGQDAKVLLKG